MTEEKRCERTELLVSACAHCRGLGELPSEESNEVRYEGVVLVRLYDSAQHEQACALFPEKPFDGHYILQGERFALAARKNAMGGTAQKRIGYVCDNCVDYLSRGTSVQ